MLSYKPTTRLLSPLLSFNIYYYFLCMSALSVCMYVHLIHAWYPQKSEGGLDSLELELRTIVSYYMATKNRTWILCKSSQMLLITKPPLQTSVPFLSASNCVCNNY